MAKMVHFGKFLKPEACGEIVLPDESFLNRKKIGENAKIEKFKWFNICNGRVPTISRLRCLLVVDDCENKLPFYMQKRGVKIHHHHDIMFNIIVFSTLVVNPLLSLYMFMVFNMAKKAQEFFVCQRMRWELGIWYYYLFKLLWNVNKGLCKHLSFFEKWWLMDIDCF